MIEDTTEEVSDLLRSIGAISLPSWEGMKSKWNFSIDNSSEPEGRSLASVTDTSTHATLISVSPAASSSPTEMPSATTPSTPTTKRRGGAAPAPILPVLAKPSGEDDEYDDYEDEDASWDEDEDDEIMAAQRAEFAALWGISLTDMVDQKEDREFFKLMSKIQVIDLLSFL